MKRAYDLVKLLTIIIFAGFCVITYGEMILGWGRLKSWVYGHETLAGAFLAVASALAGAWLLNRQTTQQLRLEHQRTLRRREATRAVLPLALSAITDYATESAYVCKTLLDLCEKNALSVPVTIALPPMPPVPSEAISVLKDLIEYIEEDYIPTLSGFIADIQVQHSRIASTLADAKSGLGPIIVTRNLEDYAIDCALIHARASSLFDYGRRRTETIPQSITWREVSLAISMFDFHDFEYPSLHAMIDRRSGSNPSQKVQTRWRAI